MVSAETFAGLKIYNILVDVSYGALIPCTVNGTDHYGGLGVTWEASASHPLDVDVAEDDDAAFAGVLVPDGNHDLDTALSDNQAASVATEGCIVWAKFVASCGDIVRGEQLSISGSADGYFTKTSGTALVRGTYLQDSDGHYYHADVAAVTIGMIRVKNGGIIAAS